MRIAPCIVMAGICLLLCRIAVFDLACQRIPNRLTLQVAFMALPAYLCGFPTPLPFLDRCVAAGVLGGAFFLIALATGGFGGGDVKLLAALGLFFGLRDGLFVVMGSFFMGGAVGVLFLLLKKDARTVFPFGPCICFSAFAVILASP